MKIAVYIVGILCIIAILVAAFIFPFKHDSYKTDYAVAERITLPPPFVVTHVKTPGEVKALYISSWTAGNSKLRDNIVKMIDDTELNSIVIDVKDYTGRISFITGNPQLEALGAEQERVSDMKEFIGILHDRGIYVIARISTFQDSYLVNKKPEYAVTTKSGAVWKDYKGVSWLDVGAKPVWEYTALIGDESYKVGFDELNFDYIRFPSDGNMLDIAYPYSQGKVKSQALEEFFVFLDDRFRTKGIPISADLFGMTTSNSDDLGIGQVLENALAHFDYVAPMVYPSHYPKTFMGIPNPASKPYEIVKYAMGRGVERAIIASSTPNKLRPWIQDFSIGGVVYSPEMVRAQIQATYDVKLNSWMLWNASNIYTAAALEAVEKVLDSK